MRLFDGQINTEVANYEASRYSWKSDEDKD